FPQIESLFDAASRCATLDLNCSVQGNELLAATVPAEQVPFLKGTARFLKVLAKARELARRFNANPPLPSGFGAEHGREVEQLYQVVVEGEYRRRVPGARVTMHFATVQASRLLEAAEADDAPLEIHSIDDQKHPFLGVEVNIGKLKQVFTHTRLSTRR